MQFFTIATLFLATAMAAPSQDGSVKSIARRGPNSFCPPGLLYTNPLCCNADVAGIADLDCEAPKQGPSSCKSFAAICAATGRQPKCCALPIAGQALLCTDPQGAGSK